MIKHDNNNIRNDVMRRISVTKAERREMHDFQRKTRKDIIAQRNAKLERAEAERASQMSSHNSDNQST